MFTKKYEKKPKSTKSFDLCKHPKYKPQSIDTHF